VSGSPLLRPLQKTAISQAELRLHITLLAMIKRSLLVAVQTPFAFGTEPASKAVVFHEAGVLIFPGIPRHAFSIAETVVVCSLVAPSRSTSSDLMRTALVNLNATNVIVPCDGPMSTYFGCNITDCQAAVQPGVTGVPEGLFEMAGNSGNVVLRPSQNISKVLSDGDPRTTLLTASTDGGHPLANGTSGNDTSGHGKPEETTQPCPSSSNSGAMAGVGVGVGVPLLIIIGVLSWLLLRKKKNAGLGAVHEHNGYATKTPGPPHQIATEQASPHGYNNTSVQPPVNIAKTSVTMASPEMEAERRYG
jgi:hypothetical protein